MPSRKVFQSMSPRSVRLTRAAASGHSSRKAMFLNERVELVTTCSNCMHRLFTSAHTFIR